MTRILASAVVVALVGCGGSSSPTVAPTPTPPPSAAIHVSIDPNPIHAVASADPNYPWDFRFNVLIYDSGGVGFTVTKLEYVVKSAISGYILDRVDSAINGTHYPAFGRIVRQYHETPYSMENGTKEAKATVNYYIVDDNLHHFDGSTSANVLFDGRVVVLP